MEIFMSQCGRTIILRFIIMTFLLAFPGGLFSQDIEKPCTHITYSMSGGRFGDNMIAYMHAKWCSYLFDIPLLYKPFKYSERLALHKIEEQHSLELQNKFDKVIVIKNESSFISGDPRSLLYLVHYFPECESEAMRFPSLPFFHVDWEDEVFRNMLKDLIRPINPIPKMKLPKDRITVAVHMRLGGGVDPKHYFRTLPLKFPPLMFYMRQVKRLNKMFENKPMYVYLFTDDLQPLKIKKQFEKEVNAPNIVFDCRVKDNKPDANVLKDFYAIGQFDCLIRPESNFSIAAEKIADHKVIIYPASFQKTTDKVWIDKINVFIREENKKYTLPN